VSQLLARQTAPAHGRLPGFAAGAEGPLDHL
jgi:hypothetical protein